MKNLFGEYKVKKAEHKIDYSYQELGIELQEYFGVKWVWRFFYIYPESKIREAFKITKERGMTKPSYMVGVMKKL